jgi:hypothetical protein
MSQDGRVEIMSADFVIGWAAQTGPEPVRVHAVLDGEVVGHAEANVERPDLARAAATSSLRASAFVIAYRAPVGDSRRGDVAVFRQGASGPLERSLGLRIDRTPRQQIFVFGSPRSGTSELGATLARTLDLPWLGEGHAAPLFATAAASLSGDTASPNGLVRFMAQQNYRALIIEEARRAYYYAHASASFVDKTPGVPMIKAAPFVLECFPTAKAICLRRNGISNVLSRMVKFGGNFDRHCADWAAAMNEWVKVRQHLPHYLEVNQEDMLADPDAVAERLAAYIGCPDSARQLGLSLGSGSREKTGAGIGRTTLAQTGWSADQIRQFRHICGPTMEAFGYPMDARQGA